MEKCNCTFGFEKMVGSDPAALGQTGGLSAGTDHDVVEDTDIHQGEGGFEPFRDLAVGGGRLGRFPTDTMKAWRHVPCIETDDMMASVPFGCIPVAVEMHARARPLESFVHPERAIYIFGPEDGSVQKSIVERVPIVVQINTNRCMNLAAAVNVVLYDRAAKRQSAR